MSLITNIRNFFKRIFNKDVEALPKPTEELHENKNKNKIVRTSENNEISEKNIVMFLYKQLRLGNLDPKYIPDEYRDKIAALLKGEKEIKQKQIKEINQKIRNY